MVSYWLKFVPVVLVNRLGGLSLHRNSVVRLTFSSDMTIAVYRGLKATKKQQQPQQRKEFTSGREQLISF